MTEMGTSAEVALIRACDVPDGGVWFPTPVERGTDVCERWAMHYGISEVRLRKSSILWKVMKLAS